MVIVVGLAVAVIVVVMIVDGRRRWSAFSVGVLLLLLLDDLVASEVDLAVHVVGDDVVPIGEAVVEFLDVLLALGDLLFVLLLLALVFLFDPLALGLEVGFRRLLLGWSFLAARPWRPCRPLLVGLVGVLPSRLGRALLAPFSPFASAFALPALFPWRARREAASSTGLAMASGLNSAMTSR